MLAVYDFPAALQTGLVQDGFVFASNFDPNSVPGAAGLNLKKADSTDASFPATTTTSCRASGSRGRRSRAGTSSSAAATGMFYERTTGGFANSLRQAPPFFRELQLNNLGDYNTVPSDFPALPIPAMSVGFDDGEPILVGSNDPDNEFEALETQMVSPDLQTPYLQQWSINTQWEFRPNWLLEVGYIGTQGHQPPAVHQPEPGARHRCARRIPAACRASRAAGSPATTTPSSTTASSTRGRRPRDAISSTIPASASSRRSCAGRCSGSTKTRAPTRSISNGKSWYHALQTSLQKRFTAGYMFNVNYTFSRAIDYFSDEGLFQIEHDQSRPELNKGLSDFHRKHRLILSWAWDLPFRGNAFVEGWQIAGIGTFQSGRPFTVTDGEFSAVLVSTTNPRPNLAPGATHEDQTTQRIGRRRASTTI